jgi:hypothetical protein
MPYTEYMYFCARCLHHQKQAGSRSGGCSRCRSNENLFRVNMRLSVATRYKEISSEHMNPDHYLCTRCDKLSRGSVCSYGCPAETQPTKGKHMKLRNAIVIADESLTTIGVQYHGSKGPGAQTYTFICTKGLAATLKEDDMVIIEGRDKGTLNYAYVVEVHEESEIDIDADYDHKYAFQKVDRALLDALKTAEEGKLQEIKKQQREHYRSQVRDGLKDGSLLTKSSRVE